MNNKSVLITGSSRGIGKELALAYGKQGHSIILIARNEKQLIENQKQIIASGGQANYISCDVSKPDDLQAAINEAYSIIDRIDIAILNAGIGESISFTKDYPEKLRYIFEVNFFSAVVAMDILVPKMKEQGGGTIAAVGSLADFGGLPGSAAYSTSKIALSHYLESARIELKQHNIRIITIKPGFVKTDMTARHKYPMPFIMNAAKAAKIIINGIDINKNRIYFPFFPAFVVYIFKLLPGSITDKILGNWKNQSSKYD